MKGWLIFALLAVSMASVHFSEEFGEGWESRWVESNWRSDGSKAAFKHSHGQWFVDAEGDKGIQTSQDYRFYALSAKFPEFSTLGKDLVLQFTVKFEQQIDCGGGYIKLLKSDFDQANFGGDTPYHIMFGPDICGGERKTHLILGYKDKNYQSTKKFRVDSDVFTHQYTAWIRANNTYQLLIDNIEVSKGALEDHWEMLPPKTIKDPEAKKPEDWVDEPTVVDETDKKPEGWDDIPEMVPDSNAKKPDDWSEEDGEWTPPLVRNPEYKGEWKAKRIPNPAYKGEWKHPMIPNPEYVADPNLYAYEHVGGLGIEVWQVKSGTIFDNIWIGDSIEEAREFSKKTFEPRKNGEKAAKEAYDEAHKPAAPEEPELHEEDQREETEEDFEEIKKEDL